MESLAPFAQLALIEGQARLRVRRHVSQLPGALTAELSAGTAEVRQARRRGDGFSPSSAKDCLAARTRIRRCAGEAMLDRAFRHFQRAFILPNLKPY